MALGKNGKVEVDVQSDFNTFDVFSDFPYFHGYLLIHTDY
jgi:hypothetical protein